ncbi:aminotransferase class I/II-fold pyridoxal phosphate-dependent enzyme [Chitinophaga oryziterrae]|uniref:Aminotransferase class I/II-fold pyridoxal phosphate-dependent enzyme n=1 Tax=Chitinophaga oryziterrae TaxID=1031224 RepID=A0A6N8J6F1_9BACT|nr:pyridoxal phosphate-dependent aminotransferase family protein [Chitinophaga oryziterrae]MVT40188.1 aminotransferase class I/II-fold pyridoxal phosphate-dependent enzyme [Chitinophaga oryziterrae]
MKEDFLLKHLSLRKEQHAFRELRIPAPGMTDFCSNDYLGLARSAAMQEAVHALLQARPFMHGSTGSRLLAGNYVWIEEAESMLAAFHQSPAALIYNSGYDANIGLFSCVPQKGDTIIYDQLIHASIRDGIRLSKAQAFSFAHNDAEDLHKKLKHAEGNIFVAVESVYSMDGDMAPLADFAALCDKFNAHLIVDEAHATGVVGEKGEGLVQHLNLPCFARVHTFGKAVGCHGAVVLGSAHLRDYLINFSRSFIYTTALPHTAIAAIMASYDLFPYMNGAREHLSSLISQFQNAGLNVLPSETPIQVVLAPGNEVIRQLAEKLQSANLDVRAIMHPTVPRGKERLRIVLHSYNTTEEVDQLIGILSS